MRGRKVTLVCYEEPTEQQLSGAIRWAYILHDKDTMVDKDTGEVVLKKPHYHVYMEFGNPRYFSAVARDFGLPEAAINKVANVRSSLAYLTHRTRKAQEDGKYLYDPSDVVRSEDMDFDFSEFVDTAELIDWMAIFTQPTLHEAFTVYKAQGQRVDSLQQFKNFVQSYYTVQLIQRGVDGQV